MYAWTLTFPPGKTVSVRHSDAPFLGSGITQSWIPDDRGFSARALRDELCASPGLIHRLERSAPRDAAPLWGGTVSYILKTANTWRGPIRDFTLRLRKSSFEESISLCFPGQFKKVDALTLEAKIADFAPAGIKLVHPVGGLAPEASHAERIEFRKRKHLAVTPTGKAARRSPARHQPARRRRRRRMIRRAPARNITPDMAMTNTSRSGCSS